MNSSLTGEIEVLGKNRIGEKPSSHLFVTSADLFTHIRGAQEASKMRLKHATNRTGNATDLHLNVNRRDSHARGDKDVPNSIKIRKHSSAEAERTSDSISKALMNTLGEATYGTIPISSSTLLHRRQQFFQILFGAETELLLPPLFSTTTVGDLLGDNYRQFSSNYYYVLQNLTLLLRS